MALKLQPGPQMPTKYARTGPTYQKYGEQQGFIYDPLVDKYRPDPNARKQWEIDNGFRQPDPEVVDANDVLKNQAMSQGISTLGTIGGLWGASKLLGGGGAGGLLGGGGAAASAGTGAAAAGAGAAGSTLAAPTLLSAGTVGGGGIGGAGAGGAAATGGGLLGGVGILPLAGIAAGTYLGGREALGLLGGNSKPWSRASGQDKAGRVVLGMATGGLSEVARLAGLGRETTDDRSKRRYDEISGLSQDAAFQNAIKQGRDEDLAGKDTWDIGDSLDSAPLEMMSRSSGVLGALGPEFAALPADKQIEIVRQMAAQNQINNKQGAWIVEDPTAAKAIYDSVIGGK